MIQDSTVRFSSRVEDYVKYRPSYPPQVIELLRSRCGLGPGVPVADLGSGTGILTVLLLDAGARVFAVEPNADMRAAAERLLGTHPAFVSVAGTGEATGLEAGSVALLVAAQAFHWFDPERARIEARRILQPQGWAAFIWNEHPEASTPLLADYHELLKRHAPEYEQVRSQRGQAESLQKFFGRTPERAVFANRQIFDFTGFKGRLTSSSYAPRPGTPQYEPMVAQLRQVFERHQRGGQVEFPYETLVFFAQP